MVVINKCDGREFSEEEFIQFVILKNTDRHGDKPLYRYVQRNIVKYASKMDYVIKTK